MNDLKKTCKNTNSRRFPVRIRIADGKVLCNGYSKEDDKILELKNILLPDDIVAVINYLINLPYGVGNIDDIDYLGNRRIRSVGELYKISSE